MGRRHVAAQFNKVAACVDKCGNRSLDTNDPQVPINSGTYTELFVIVFLGRGQMQFWTGTNSPRIYFRHVECFLGPPPLRLFCLPEIQPESPLRHLKQNWEVLESTVTGPFSGTFHCCPLLHAKAQGWMRSLVWPPDDSGASSSSFHIFHHLET